MSRKKTIIITLASFSLIIIVVWMVLSPQHEVRYTIKDLGTLGADYSFPVSINNRGHVAGVSDTPTGSQQAFLWTPEEGMQNIGFFRPGGMNERDEIVGSLRTNSQACLWTPTEGLIDLGTIDGGGSEAYGINNRSEVVGVSGRSQSRLCGFVWTATEGMRPLDHKWQAYDINDAGEILCSTHTNGRDPFVYSRVRDEVIPSEDLTSSLKFSIHKPEISYSSEGGEIRNCLPFYDVESKFPTRIKEGYWVYINDSNEIQIVGSVVHENSYVMGRLYKIRGLYQILYRPLEWVTHNLFTDSRAVLWEGEEAIDLTNRIPPESGWRRLIRATGINESGQIVGAGVINGECHAFLLTPIDESGDDTD